jgi:hypothetical protein
MNASEPRRLSDTDETLFVSKGTIRPNGSGVNRDNAVQDLRELCTDGTFRWTPRQVAPDNLG